MAAGRRQAGTGAHRSIDTPLRRGAAVVAVTGGAFSLVGAASPAQVPVVPVVQAELAAVATRADPVQAAAMQATAVQAAAVQPDAVQVDELLAAAADGVLLRPAVEPVDPDPDVIDATGLVKAVQLAEDVIERITAERAAADERAAQERAESEARQRAEEEAVAATAAATGADCGMDTSDLGRVKSHVEAAAEFLGCQYGEPEMFGVAGRAGTSDHPGGLAVDFMVSRVTGDALAACALENMDELGIKYVIWEQRINHGNGWSSMEDRGGDTANHLDHVHISFDQGRGSGNLNGC